MPVNAPSPARPRRRPPARGRTASRARGLWRQVRHHPTGKLAITTATLGLILLALQHVVVTATLLAAGLGGGTLYVRARLDRARRASTVDPRTLSPDAFERYIAALCERDGLRDVRVVGGAGDLAADVLATLPDRRWWQLWLPRSRRILIQAKRYADGTKVKSEDVQCVNGTYRDIHGCTVAAVVTTSTYTRAAEDFAGRVGITLLDGQRLDSWAAGNRRAAPWN